jgi:DNA-binding NarL/FixJ family response regulator
MSALPPIRVLIADDHALVRAGLCKLLETLPDMQVVGEAEHGEAALEQVALLMPDVLLLDLAMPGGGGLQAAAQMQTQWPQVRVIVLSMHQEAQYVRQALKIGASGYLVKDSAPAELELALRAVMRGEIYLSPAVSKAVVGDYVDRLRSDDANANPLTPRQTEILVLIAKGQSTKDIARMLDLSVKTVETHRSQLMRELGVHEVTGLVRYALRQGLLTLDT